MNNTHDGNIQWKWKNLLNEWSGGWKWCKNVAASNDEISETILLDDISFPRKRQYYFLLQLFTKNKVHFSAKENKIKRGEIYYR